MGKSQTMYRDTVVNSDAFLMLSIESQCLYFHMQFEATSIGELPGVRRLARSYGMGETELRELRDTGYLLEIDGRWFITHYYLNNSKPKNERMKGAAARLWENRPESLDYEGEPFNSKLVSLTAGEHAPNYSDVLARNCNSNGNCNGNGNEKSGACAPLVREVVEYLNARTGKGFKTSAKATARAINARAAEGYELADFKRVIDIKTTQWASNPQMAQYLRPETLFSAKHFESYLNEVSVDVHSVYD